MEGVCRRVGQPFKGTRDNDLALRMSADLDKLQLGDPFVVVEQMAAARTGSIINTAFKRWTCFARRRRLKAATMQPPELLGSG